MGNVMLVKVLVLLGLAAGMTQCKTSKVKSPQQPSATNSADAEAFDMPKFLLTENAESGADLTVDQNSIKVEPYVLGDANLIIVNFAAKKPSDVHYGVVKLCFDITETPEQCFPEVYTPLFSTEFAPPKTYNGRTVTGAMSVQVRACNASNEKDSGCGALSERVNFSLGAPNPEAANSNQMALLEQRAANKVQLNNFLKEKLDGPATKFKEAFEKKYDYPKTNNYRNASKEEQMLYTTAHNIKEAPWAMQAVYSSAILESMAETAAQGSQSASLALTEQQRGAKTDITNSLNCDAAGYIWVNAERACYQPKQEESKYSEVKIHKRWTNSKAIAGEILIFGAMVGGATWAVHDYIKSNRLKVEGYADVINTVDELGLPETEKLKYIREYNKVLAEGGSFRQVGGNGKVRLVSKGGELFEIKGIGPKEFGGPGTKVYPITAGTAAKISTISAAAIIGTILFIDGAASYSLASPNTYQEHFNAFKASLKENANTLATLKKTQCSIESELFSVKCD